MKECNKMENLSKVFGFDELRDAKIRIKCRFNTDWTSDSGIRYSFYDMYKEKDSNFLPFILSNGKNSESDNKKNRNVNGEVQFNFIEISQHKWLFVGAYKIINRAAKSGTYGTENEYTFAYATAEHLEIYKKFESKIVADFKNYTQQFYYIKPDIIDQIQCKKFDEDPSENIIDNNINNTRRTITEALAKIKRNEENVQYIEGIIEAELSRQGITIKEKVKSSKYIHDFVYIYKNIKTYFDIKIIKSNNYARRTIYKYIDNISSINKNNENKFILLILSLEEQKEISEVIKNLKKLEYNNIEIWDLNKFSKQLSFFTEPKSTKSSTSKNDTIYNPQNSKVTLFLGAGVSKDYKLPEWNTLIKMIAEKVKEKENKNDVNNFLDAIEGDSLLIQIRKIKMFVNEKELKKTISTIYNSSSYKNRPKTTLSTIPDIIQNNNIDSIITYNFDDYLEQVLKNSKLDYLSVYTPQAFYDKEINNLTGKTKIYHVHGFIPQGYADNNDDNSDLNDSHLVFSEEDYHQLYESSYDWRNLVQYNALVNNICVFIGLSFNDPNLRRILELVAHNQFEKKSLKFYTIQKRPENESIYDTKFFNELNIEVFWVDDFDAFPQKLIDIFGGKKGN